MNEEIRDIVGYLKINKERENSKLVRETLFKLERKMAKMTFDRNIGLYAFCLDEIEYLDSILYKSKNKEKIYKKINELEEKKLEYEKTIDVEEYSKTRWEHRRLLQYNDYYVIVNDSLREELVKIKELPNIYIKQKESNNHIITKEENNNIDLLIEPLYDLESKRKYRHFYNKVSYHYLEELTKDCSFDVKQKKLGKILIKDRYK